jgi:hypothetical protein
MELANFLDDINQTVHNSGHTHSGYHRQAQLMLQDLYEEQEITQHMNIVGSVNPLNESKAAPAGSKSHHLIRLILY